MKKITLIVAAILVSTVAFALQTHSVSAQAGFTALAPIPGLTDQNSAVVNSTSLAAFFNNLYKYIIGLAATIAVIQIIWAGIEIALNRDDVSKITDDKGKIYNAIYGLILVLSPALVFSIINPNILNLSLNLPPLDTVSGSSLTGTQTSTGTEVAATFGCVITGGLLKTALCPTQQAAQDFAAACSTGSGNVPFFTTDHKATCGTEKGSITGPYSFADTSTGILATLTGYSKYEPLESTPSNPNNGSAVLQFASACTADGGTTCLSTVKLPCASKVVQLVFGNGSASCWNISLSCTDGKTGAGGCSSNPQFKTIK